MPNITEFVASYTRDLLDLLCNSPADITSTAKSLAICTFTKTRLISNINFVGSCLCCQLVPIGFAVKLHVSSYTSGYKQEVHSVTSTYN